MRRHPGALAALLLALVMLGLVAAAPAADGADRDFSPRFSVNDTGDIDIFGNTLMTCPASASGCTAAQQSGAGTTTDSSLQNNNYAMQYIDVDSDTTTINSSRATVTIPAGSTVLFAGLYWGGRAVGSSAYAQRNQVKFRTPTASGYESLTATTLDDGGGGSTDSTSIYQGFVDVTSRVQTAGSGVYTVGNVQSTTGSDKLAGWSLVVAYRNTSQPARNLTVFDGLKSIGSGATGTINVSGFTTPPAGSVNTRVGFVNYEGDGGITGDSASLNSTVLGDAQHPATNFFNSRSSRDGALRSGQTPSYPNQLGVEQSILLANNVLGNNATSATIRLTSSGDVYAPGVVTFATELYAPKVEQTKTVKDVNGGDLEQGDVLEYTITGSNTGQDGARDFVVRDPIPTNTVYVPGSLRVTPSLTGGGATAATSVTDAAGDDRGEYASSGNQVVARVGVGATTTAGGNVPVNGTASTYAVTFQVKVGGPSPAIASDTTISNTATASFASQSLGTALTSNAAATAPVKIPDLTLTKAGQGTIVRGRPYTYRVTVKNDGDAKTQGLVSVTDTLPAGVTAGANAASGTGWTCTNTSTTFTCTRNDALGAGASYPAIDLVTNVASDAPASIANTASVTGGGDGDLSNNTGTATNGPTSSADLAVTKTASAATAPVGGTVTYTLRVANGGPSRSTGSVVTDALPAGLTYVSSSVGCVGTAASSTVTCTVGALASGASTDFTVVAKPAAGTAGRALRNAATVAGTDPDPAAGNDSSSVSVDVLPVDLRITNTIQGAPATLNPNATSTWLLGVTNAGGSAAANSIVRFDVPAGTTVDPGTLDPRCSVAGSAGNQIVTCNLGTIDPAGGTGANPLAIPLTTTSTPGAAIATSASVATTEPDRDLGNNTATTSTPVVQSVDLGVTFLANPGPVRAGENLTLTAVVKNEGPAQPVAPKLTVPLPAGTSFVSAPAGCALNTGGTAVVCDLTASDLDAGESVTKAIVVKAGANPGPTISATATVSTTSPDTNPSNDRAAQTVQVIESVDLAVTLAADPGTARPGQLLTLTASVRNNGPGRPDGPTVTIPIPAGTTFDSAPAGCALIGTGAAVVCTLPADGLDTGESLTRPIRVRVGDAPDTTISAAVAVATSSTDTVSSNNNASLTVPVDQTVDLGVTITPAPTPVRPGQDLTLTVVTRNDGAARPAAPRVTIPLPPGTTFVSGPGCALGGAGDAIVCDLTAADLEAGESVTKAIVVQVGANPGPSIPVAATVSTTSTDTNGANDRATASVTVLRDVDLGVTLTADPGTTSIGEDLKLTAVVRNDGDGRPADPKVAIPLPAGTTVTGTLPNGCAVNGAGTIVACDLTPADLDAGESVTREIVVRVGPGAGSSLDLSATVSTTSPDTNTANDRATLTVPVTAGSDVAIRKSTTASVFQGGDTVTYTLAARNNGPATARNVVVADDVPAALDVVSMTTTDACTVTGNAVRCDLGSLAPNAERTVTIQTRAKPTADSPASSSIAPKIKLTVEQRYETLAPGETRTIDVQCRDGENTPSDPSDDSIGIASDGTLQIVDLTTAQQTAPDVEIRQASAISASTYRFVVRNGTTGTAQVRPHVTCLPAKTDDGQHDVVTGPLRTQTRTIAAGRHEFVFPLSGGDRAIAPGVEAVGGQVRLVGSEPVAGGWKLVVDVLEPATVTASLRDLDDWTSVSGDPAHAHRFVFVHVEKSVTLGAGEWLRNSNERGRVSCNDDQRQGYEGVVASYDLPAGVVSTGNIPMPVNRDFDLLNTTNQAQTLKIDLECIRLQTGDALTAADVVNTATIATSTGDTNDANNRSVARILLERKPAPAPAPADPAPAPRPDPTPAPTADPTPTPDPAPAPRPDAPAAPAAPSTPSTPVAARASILSTALRVTGSSSRATVALPVRCATACTGTATLRAISSVRGTTLKRNAVLGKAALKLKAGRTTTVRLVAKGTVAKALRRGGVQRAKLVVSTGKGTTVAKTVRLVLK